MKKESDGRKIKNLRETRGMTQDVLADAIKCDRRTIQRAEEGKRLRLETLAGLASVFDVTVSEITVEGPTSVEEQNSAQDKNAVVLRRTASGKVLLDAICESFSGSIQCEADPTPESVDTLVAVVGELENFMPDPWDEAKVNRLFNGEEKLTPLSERLRRSFALSAHLQKLEQQSIGVFVGTYTARAQRPRYNADEGSLSISTNQRFEPVTVCKVRLASSLADKVVILVDDIWEGEFGFQLDEDISL